MERAGETGGRPTTKNKTGNDMADLTLDEYRGVTEEELKRLLKEEARKIEGSDWLGNKGRETIEESSNLFKLLKKFSSGLVEVCRRRMRFEH